ncbi:MAG: hypothetical protein OXQ29_18670 [Rhodospirillaceae bacterium]|nr:hypothetical protein [Rhodospirillaceae bacterium]
MNQPKNHHFIPVMILKRFVDDDGWLHCCSQGGEATKFWQEVFPGDEAWISVYDDGIGEDDLHGLMVLRTGTEMPEGRDMTAAMPNVRPPVLRIIAR